MASNINVLMSLTDKFSTPMKKIETKTKEAERQLKSAQNTLSRFGKKANNVFTSTASTVAKFGAGLAAVGVGLAIAKLKSLGSESMQLAETQLQAEKKLGAILKNVDSIASRGSEAYKQAAENLKAYAGDLQNVGVIGDEVTLSGMAQLATFQMNDEQIKVVSASMLDLLANTKGLKATQEDAVNVANMIGKAFTGQATALSRVGITMTEEEKEIIKNGDANQRAAMIAQVLAKNVGGVNKALAETDAGKAQQAMNNYGDMLEEFGKRLLPLKARLYGAFGATLPKIQKAIMPFLDKMAEKIDAMMPVITVWLESFADKLPGAISAAADMITGFIHAVEVLYNIGQGLMPILAGVVAGFTAFNVAMKIVQGLALVTKMMQGVAAAGGLMNLVLSMNPIGLVAIAIAAFVALLVACHNRSEKFRAAVDGLWARLLSLGEMVATYLGPVLSATWNVISTGFGGMVDIIASSIANILNIFNGLIDFIVGVFTGNWQKAWQGVVEIFRGIFGGLLDVAMEPLNIIMDKVSAIREKISGISLPGFGGPERHNATGSAYFPGGSTYVNEGNRGELINLPSGSQIVPHDVAAKAETRQNVSVSVTVQGNVIGNEEFINHCGSEIAKRVQLALGNS